MSVPIPLVLLSLLASFMPCEACRFFQSISVNVAIPTGPSEGVSIQLQTEDVYYILEDNPIPYTVTSDGERVQDAVLNIEFSNITTNGQFRATYDDEFIHVVCVNADDVFRSGSVDITVSVVGTDATVTKTFKTLII